MLPRSTRSLGFIALAALAGCTVEGSRQAGDSCLMSRECAAPLRCELTAEGVSRCVPPVRLDLPAVDASAPPPDVAAPPDAPPDVAAPPDAPPMDQPAPPDAPAPMDVPREMPAPADVPREPDVADEPRADAGADLPDDVEDDRPREAATD
jgi:hypothetical protein